MGFYIPKIKRMLLIMVALLSAFIVFAIVIMGSWAAKTQKEIAGGVLRLHILANSDGEADQKIKLRIRDKILEECGYLLQGVSDVKDAEEQAQKMCGRMKRIAEKELRREGILYPVMVCIEDAVFPTKEYGRVRLPAGKYRAINVRIGSATGQNWWCVLYPPLCLTEDGVKADEKTTELLQQELSLSEYALITEKEGITIKSKFYLLEQFGKFFTQHS